jgi:regulator of cell morphogenesis and NO signaling
MTVITEDTTVREVVVAYPQLRRVLERHRVDYCCNGQMKLKAAAQRAGVDYVRLVADLKQAITAPLESEAGRDWSRASMGELAGHIVQKHHAYLRQQMPRVDALLDTVMAAHRPHAEMLMSMRRVFDALRAEIDAHMMKEEMVLFPYIKRLDDMAGRREPFAPMHCGTVANPIGQMQREHDSAGVALAELRRLSADYTLPADACPTFAELYKSLQDIEADLHEHIHMENNILFPRAISTEATLALN